MLAPKLVLLFAVGTLLIVSGLFDLGWRRRRGRDESL
jgi:hypothetical protein